MGLMELVYMGDYSRGETRRVHRRLRDCPWRGAIPGFCVSVRYNEKGCLIYSFSPVAPTARTDIFTIQAPHF